MSDDEPSLESSLPDDDSNLDDASDDGSDNVKPVNPIPAGDSTPMVGWTIGHGSVDGSTARSSRSIRPMHVRLSVRIHHISFLHPGLDAGGFGTANRRGKKKWNIPLPSISDHGPASNAGTPGPFAFGQRRGSWKNPAKSSVFKRTASVDIAGQSSHGDLFDHEETAPVVDDAEISEIIAGESFRLSRDGIIQQHYAFTNALRHQQQQQQEQPQQQQQQQQPQQNKMALPTVDPETARYYQECARRPKGYRRLVVSSTMTAVDDKIPPPPPPERQRALRMASSKGLGKQGGLTLTSPRSDEEEMDSCDRVEYRYIGPPNTGPAFFQLLRNHGAASFGRFLPEVACSVPKHAIGFELRKSKRRKRGAATSTQPIVIEAPHVIWGDARDKAFSRIAKEGCPLIDARPFEYASNANLNDAALSESLLVCGATVWVQNAPDHDTTMGSTSTLRSKHTKALVKAEYYGGKIADGVREGVKGVALGTKEVVEAGTRGVVDAGKMIIGSPTHKDKLVDASASATSHTDETKKIKNKAVRFIPTKVRKKFKRGKETVSGGDSQSVSSAPSVADDVSFGSESIVTQTEANILQKSNPDADVHKSADADDRATETRYYETDAESLPESKTPDYTVVKSVPYILILDDIINLRVVSFPEKQVIAKFPISVASVMVQRSVDDRISDPLKPSELTATLIQDPSAPKLRWGVELKITIRAVEVKPQVPRVIIPDMSASVGDTMDSFEAELKKFKDRMVSLGKSQEEIEQAMQDKETQMTEYENELDLAIVSAGFGKGAYGGANPDEIRKRQMFYDEREHKSIERKVKRRARLTQSQIEMLRDARVDPSAGERKDDSDKEQKILSLLNMHFPRIEGSIVSINAEKNRESSKLSLQKIDEANSMHSDPVGVCQPGNVFPSLSLAIAESLDNCLGEYLEQPTVQIVKQVVLERGVAGFDDEVLPMTASSVKQWCFDVAQQLSMVASSSGEHLRGSISHLQNIVVSSAMGTVAESLTYSKAELKEELDSSDLYNKVRDWCSSVVSKLDICAEELDEQDNDDSTQFSFNEEEVEATPLSFHGKATGDEPLDKLPGATKELSSMRKQSYDAIKSLQSVLPMCNQKDTEPDDSDSVNSDDSLLKQAASLNQSGTFTSSNTERLLRASTLSPFSREIPSRNSVPAHKFEPLLKNMRDSHFEMHRSCNEDEVNHTQAELTQHLGSNTDTNVRKAVGRLDYLVIAVFVLFSVGGIIVTKYGAWVSVVIFNP